MKKKLLKLTMGVFPILGVVSILLHGGCQKIVPPAAAQGALVVAPNESVTPESGEASSAKTDEKEGKKDDDKDKTTS